MSGESPESETAAAPESVLCPVCRRFFTGENNFCPTCGRSRTEIQREVDERAADAEAARAASNTWIKIRRIAKFYVALLALNFIAAYVLPLEKTWGVLLLDCVLISVSLIWSFGSKKLISTKFGTGFTPVVLALLPLTAVATYALTVLANTLFLKVLGLEELAELKGTEDFFEAQIPLVIQVISTCAIPGIFEEIFFRGLVQSTLESLMAKRQALVAQAVVFAIAHINPIGFFTYLMAMGLYLGWLRNRSGSLIPGMIVHFSHNLMVVLCARYW